MSEEDFVTPDKDAYDSLPVEEVAAQADRLIKLNGCTIYFKFTCGNCGSRQTFSKPNTLYTRGTCEECGKTSLITRAGFAIFKLVR